MTLMLALPMPNPVAPQGARRVETYKRVHETKVAPAREALLRLLTAAGWTAEQAASARGISTEHLAALVTTMAPDFDAYQAWGEVGRIGRLGAAEFAALIKFAEQHAYTSVEVQLLMNYGKGSDLRQTPQQWLVDHVTAGNRLHDITPWGKAAPGWLVAWSRTRVPPTDVPEVALGEAMLWPYMDIVLKFPNLPESVVAHTLMRSPNPTTNVDEPGAWLISCWNPKASRSTAA